MVKARHLRAAARGVLDLPVAERIDHMRRPRWIGDTRAKQLLGANIEGSNVRHDRGGIAADRAQGVG